MKTYFVPLYIISVILFVTNSIAAQNNIKNAIENFISKKMKDEYTVEYLSPEEKFSVIEEDNYKIEIELSATSDLRGKETFYVSILDENEVIQSTKINLFLKVYKNVLVAANEIPKDSFVKESDVEFNKKDITTISNYFTSKKDILGKRVLGTIKKGRVLRSTSIRDRYNVTVGDNITVISKQGAVVAKTGGISHQNGYIGEIIRVYTPSFKKTVDVKLKSSNVGIIPK